MDYADMVVGAYRVLASPDKLPSTHSMLQQKAVLAEQFDLSSAEGVFCFFGIGEQAARWPQLVVSQRYKPAGYGFNPGVLVVPETKMAFIGAGTRLLAYRLEPTPSRVWIDQADCGFWGWSRFADVVLMSAELELAAWTIQGDKLWSTFVEPPWHYTVAHDLIELNVMGNVSRLHLRSGSPAT